MSEKVNVPLFIRKTIKKEEIVEDMKRNGVLGLLRVPRRGSYVKNIHGIKVKVV